MVTFVPNRLLGHETHGSYEMVSKPKPGAVATFLMFFGAHMDIFFVIKVKMILMLSRWSYRTPPPVLSSLLPINLIY